MTAKTKKVDKAKCECGSPAMVHCCRCGRPRCEPHFKAGTLEGWKKSAFDKRTPMCTGGGCAEEKSRLTA